jgi:hypothetical protein
VSLVISEKSETDINLLPGEVGWYFFTGIFPTPLL